MPKKSVLLAGLAGIVLTSSQAALADHHEAPDSPPHFAVIDTSGKEIGTLVLEQTPNGVLLDISVAGLPEGEHGFHLHGKGICDPAQGFKTAGGHYSPREHDHGIREPSGPHAGDMPNQFVGKDGILRAHVLNPNVTLGPGFNSLFDEDGSALIIHAGADDYWSQPTGNAGGRLACAVISPPREM